MAQDGVGGASLRETLVQVAQGQWIDRLIDLSRRNNLLYYKPLQNGTLELTLTPASIIELLTSDSVKLKPLVALKDQQKQHAIREIARKALDNAEEKGLSTLFLTLGKATWPAEDGGRPVEAPVFLLPISLKVRGQDEATAEIQSEGTPQANLALLHILKREFGIELDAEDLLNGLNDENPADVEEEDPEFSGITRGFSVLLGKATSIPDFEIIEDFAAISNFSFQKLAMVNDLKDRFEELVSNDIVAAIAGDNDARSKIIQKSSDIDPSTLDQIPPKDEFEVIEADSSQQCTINGVLAGQSVVLHGPPGTGKSQTITNLIATLAARGKKVLFVAEKRAALEVVMNRLKDVGLDHLAIDLHGSEGTSKKVLEHISRTLSTVRHAVQPDCEDMHSVFTDRRQRLNDHVKRLHTPYDPTGMTVYQMQGALLKIPTDAQTQLRWRGDDLSRLSASTARTICDLLSEARGFESLFLRTDSSPWVGVSFSEGRTVQAIVDLVRKLIADDLPRFQVQIDQISKMSGLRYVETLPQAEEMLSLLSEVCNLTSIYTEEVFLPDSKVLLNQLALGRSSWLKAFWLKLSSPAFRASLKQATALRRGVHTSLSLLCTELEQIESIRLKWASIAASERTPRATEGVSTCTELYHELKRDIAVLNAVRPLLTLPNSHRDELKKEIAGLATDSSTPYKLLQLTHIEEQLCELGVQRLIGELRALKAPASRWIQIFRFAWLSSALDMVAMNDLKIHGFVGSTHDRFVHEFQSLDRDRLILSADRVRRAHAENAIAAMNEHPDQEKLIRQESSKMRPRYTVRRIFKEAGDVLTSVCPCWMASPLSVSQLISGVGGFFDYVIFDEASQILPEDAIPSILRAKHVVVAGDHHQLPPTPFFADTYIHNDEEGDGTAVGYESLLDMMLPFVKSFHLNWHYRSRDESLIAFSNHVIYGDRLVTFPGPGGAPAINHVLVSQSPLNERDKESSGPEVQKVVELVIEHAENKPDMTLGVITMGLDHAMRLQMALDQAIQSRADLADFFDPGRHERFFIKNLERVQGDERDAIIMSVGYAKTSTGKIHFGPLHQKSGERRLNVAVTRARASLTVVSSFSHWDMDVNTITPHTGVAFLRDYLEYASCGGKSFSKGELTGTISNEFESDVMDTLAANGIICSAQVGCSNFRIDLAALHPSQPGRFVLAIECDGASYHSSYTARDRDRLRQQQLEKLGWRFHRIWSTDWFLRKDEEVQRAILAFQRAVAEADRIKEEYPQKSVVPAVALPPAPVASGKSRWPVKPLIGNYSSIEDYSDSNELQRLIEWINSDGKLRSDIEIADEMFSALPFKRRGVRIQAAFEEAIAEYRDLN